MLSVRGVRNKILREGMDRGAEGRGQRIPSDAVTPDTASHLLASSSSSSSSSSVGIPIRPKERDYEAHLTC